jgi:hypothetical protein
VLPDLIGREIVHIGLAGADQVPGPVVELLEVVGGEVEVLAPVEAEPAHVLFDRLDVFQLLLDRVGVVKAQVAAAADLLGRAEVEADGLGMADVQIAVGLRRKAGDHGLAAAGVKIAADHLADEVPRPLLALGFDAAHSSTLLFPVKAALTHHP